MSKFFNKTFSLTPETLKQLEEVSNEQGIDNLSAAFRHCVKHTWNTVKQRPAKESA